MNKRQEQITQFFIDLDRSIFIDNENKVRAHYDTALPIGYGQTISQPSLVLEMTLSLDLLQDSKVLEIGTGSGYQTALLAQFSHMVYSVERIPELSKNAQDKIKDLGYKNVNFHIGDGSEGWPSFQPYDRIMVTAAALKLPKSLINQLKEGGKMIIPVGPQGAQKLLLVTKEEDQTVSVQVLGDVSFVEFKGSYGWNSSECD